ncbi:UvrD-helicase domain-containing protein [Jatrophihabitans endophyticus]|uniref:UvrD-helicase domain-containing protein n=1 Tax=Jatrophihabitans endophyticus TaxID=1206085 RepID=UPI0019DE352A|nr:UvrD-helicase domain-containing protein [Jatrophihabitans endophyticus]MBE7188637.1 UvrD-helicase domain-containing protein [Jatrophihabitans endophyticus]
MTASTAFDLCGPLPEGTTVLEASAGTGKTFTIAGLVTRYVAEGLAVVDELLVVTFGRMATQELRERVRERLVSARDGLRHPEVARAGDDELLRLLADVSDAEVAVRFDRLTVALASFDAATIVTTHEFCHRVLVTLGIAGDIDADAVLVERFDDLVDETVDDLYLRKWAATGGPTMTPADARALAHTVIDDPQAVLVPDAEPGDESPAAVRRRFADKIRSEVEARKRRANVLGFDDWLSRLRDTLVDPHTAPAATKRLRERYRVVLVDEFQDTDPVQWDILRLAFHGATTLVLIGDPKQAIYAFRGADVHAYLAATEQADHVATLAQNWRSDPDLLLGLDRVFRGAVLGDPRIAVAPVTAAHDGRSLETAGAPVRLRVVAKGDRPKLPVGPARDLVLDDLVGQIGSLLAEAPTLHPRDGSDPRPLCPGDIAVVVRTNRQLDLVHGALTAVGIPSVQRSMRSVFRTSAAADWVVLLDALEQPHRSARIRRLAMTPFVGWDATRLVDDAAVDGLAMRVRFWLRSYDERGLAALFETVARDQRLMARLLGQVDGERRLTDLRHVAETLHAEAMAGGLGLTAVLEWLRQRVREADADASTERSRRLDSDAEAVQLVTTWASKGLEFPVVLVPFDWDRHLFDTDVPLFHEPAGDGTSRRVLDVGGRGSPALPEHQRRARSEELGEDLRLLYVALTRAQALVIAWWAPSDRNTACASLHRLLFTADPTAEIPERVTVPNDARAAATLSALTVDGVLSVEPALPGPTQRVAESEPDAGVLAAATFGRGVDTAWRRSSYTALTAGAHAASPMVASEPDEPEKDDEPVTAGEPDPAAGRQLHDVVSPMDQLPGGAAFGTLVHAVLEDLDPTTGDPDVELAAQCARQLARFGPAELDADALADGLRPALATPLGAAADDRRWLDFGPADRLVELEFELPLAGGDRPVPAARLSALADVLRDHLAVDDPLAEYADQLADPVLGDAVLEGYLTGSIDAVLRVGDRFVVVDYKTNRLGVPGEPLTAWDYRPDALAAAMRQAHYPLQALLYEVALHRYLRWRLAGYDPARHLGGALYLFVRGMCGPGVRFDDGSVPGVFTWQPPAALVLAASDVLAGGHRG